MKNKKDQFWFAAYISVCLVSLLFLVSCSEANVPPTEGPKQVQDRIRNDNQSYEELVDREKELRNAPQPEDLEEAKRRQLEIEKVQRVAKETRVYELMVDSVSREITAELLRRGFSGIGNGLLRDSVAKDPKVQRQLETYRQKLQEMPDLELDEEFIRQVVRNEAAKQVAKD